MKYLITKSEYITLTTHTVLKDPIETDDIEQTRRELHQTVECDRILFTYEEQP